MRSRALLGVLGIGALALAGCSPRGIAHADEGRPSSEGITVEDCAPCHGARQVAPAWDAMAVYPDWPVGALRRPAPEGGELARGFGDLLPIEPVVQEWRVWQSILPEGDEDRGKDCLGCHLTDERRAPTSPTEIPSGAFAPGAVRPEVLALHDWLAIPERARTRTMGLWVDVDTYQSVMVATVKVLNYGAGHRAPSGTAGENIVLEVEAFDGEGGALAFLRGPTLTAVAGQELAGKPGFLYARLLADAEGKIGVPRERAARVASDTRLEADEHDELLFAFELPTRGPAEGVAWKVKARLVWRASLEPDAQQLEMETEEATSPLSGP